MHMHMHARTHVLFFFSCADNVHVFMLHVRTHYALRTTWNVERGMLFPSNHIPKVLPPSRATPWDPEDGKPMTHTELAPPDQLHPSLARSVTAACDTPIKPVATVSNASMTPTRFFFEFYMAGHPVLVKGAAADWVRG